jgi:hypothetical protein
MAESLKPIPLVFWRSATGREPVREWLNELSRGDKRTIGRDIAKVQYGWPVGLPLCRPLSGGLWEVRASLPSKRERACSSDSTMACRTRDDQEDAEDPDGRSGPGQAEI